MTEERAATTAAHDLADLRTTRLRLRRPAGGDVGALFEICSDPRVWEHFPSMRHGERTTTARSVQRWIADWDRDGLGIWTVWLGSRVIGYGGCSLLRGTVWNLGYRLAADVHGRGYATELAQTALAAARQVDPARAVVAYLLEHNTASARVAEKLGMTLVDRGPDAGNPDPDAVRLVYADRALDDAGITAARA